MKQAASRRSQCVLGAERFVTALCPLGIVTASVIDTFCCKMASRRSQCVLGAERFVTALCPLGIVTALVIDTFCCKMASFFNACPVQSDSLLPCARSVSLLPQLATPWKAHNLFQLLNISRNVCCTVGWGLAPTGHPQDANDPPVVRCRFGGGGKPPPYLAVGVKTR